MTYKLCNTFGKVFRITTYGGSHEKEVGVVIEGCPSGLEISSDEIQYEVDLRKPGQSKITTPRKEEDKVEILSGISKGKTIGKPINLRVLNKNVDLNSYKELEYKPRPGHADYTLFKKYGEWYIFDKTGGRETVGRVMGGAIAKKLLRGYGIDIFAHPIEIAGIESEISYYKSFDLTKLEEYRKIREPNPTRCLDKKAAKKMENEILKAMKKKDSVGGIVEVIAVGVPVGLGKPNYNKLNMSLYSSLGSIPAVTNIGIGLSDRARMHGSESNDEFYIENREVKTRTNYCGGILGGISTGMPIVARVGFKPTSSIGRKQKTVDLQKMENTTIEIKGRHDPCIVLRAVPVVEAMMALTLTDQMMREKRIPKNL